jgi:hypothetical protein
LSAKEFRVLLLAGRTDDIARRAVSIESRTNLLFSFEKTALRDAVRALAARRSSPVPYTTSFTARRPTACGSSGGERPWRHCRESTLAS